MPDSPRSAALSPADPDPGCRVRQLKYFRTRYSIAIPVHPFAHPSAFADDGANPDALSIADARSVPVHRAGAHNHVNARSHPASNAQALPRF